MHTIFHKVSWATKVSLLVYSDHWKVLEDSNSVYKEYFTSNASSHNFWRPKLSLKTLGYLPPHSKPEYASYRDQFERIKVLDTLPVTEHPSLLPYSVFIGILTLDIGGKTPQYIEEFLETNRARFELILKDDKSMGDLIVIILALGHPQTYRSILKVRKYLGYPKYSLEYAYYCSNPRRGFFSRPPTLQGLKYYMEDMYKIDPVYVTGYGGCLLSHSTWTLEDLPQVELILSIQSNLPREENISDFLTYVFDEDLINYLLANLNEQELTQALPDFLDRRVSCARTKEEYSLNKRIFKTTITKYRDLLEPQSLGRIPYHPEYVEILKDFEALDLLDFPTQIFNTNVSSELLGLIKIHTDYSYGGNLLHYLEGEYGRKANFCVNIMFYGEYLSAEKLLRVLKHEDRVALEPLLWAILDTPKIDQRVVYEAKNILDMRS